MSPSSTTESKSLSLKERKKRAQIVIDTMHELYPEADCALNYDSAMELLAATILSAQSTDETVNKVTENLFEKYSTPEDFASADQEKLEELVRSTGFYRSKAKYLKESARAIVEEHGGEVPDEMDALTDLHGVARKTANVVLGTYFGKAQGHVVDTHIKRVTYRIGLTDETRPEKVEQDLMEIFPRDEWIFMGHALIWHGRNLCMARKPACSECPLLENCLQRGVEDAQ